MTGPRNVRRACKRCGVEHQITTTGHIRAHACPHGKPCVLTLGARLHGDRVKWCPDCAVAYLQRGQQLLPGVE